MGGPRGGTGGPDPPPPEYNHKYIGLLSNTGLDPPKNHKATKPAFTVEPSSAGGPMMARISWYLDPLSPHQLKMFIKQEVKFGPPMKKRSGSAHVKGCAILEPYVQADEFPLEFNPQCKIRIRERSDLMVECLTRDRRVTGSSLTCDTAVVCTLEQDTLISSKYRFNPGRPT